MQKSHKQQAGSNYAAISADTSYAARRASTLTVAQLYALLEVGDTVLVDIRNPQEYPEISQLDHRRIPLRLLPDQIGLLKAKHIVLVCQTGIRSESAIQSLQRTIKKGQSLFSLAGGVRALLAEKVVSR